MTFGLAVRNGSNELLVDGERTNYVEWAAGTGFADVFTTTPTLSFPFGVSRMPLIFVQSAYWVFLHDIDTSSGLIVGCKLATFVGGFAHSVPYRLFVPATDLGPSVESHGLRLYDASATVIFDSGRTFMQPRCYAGYTRPGSWPAGLAGVEQIVALTGFSATPWVCVNPFAGTLKHLVGSPQRGYAEGIRVLNSAQAGYMLAPAFAAAGFNPGETFTAPGVTLPIIAIP